jgi:3-oxoacyl-[acyl-carrier-protein] synthase III
MTNKEILATYRTMSTAYHAEPDKKQALAAYNAAYEKLLAASGIDREDFGYLLANGELPEVPEATE